MTTVRVVASDLDGTLLGADHRLAERTIDVLRAVRRAGVKVVAATGRAPTSAWKLLRSHDVIDALVCSNGSIVFDIATETVAHRFPIDAAQLQRLFSDLDRAVPGLSYCWELDDHCGWDAEFDDIAQQHADLHMYASGPRPEPGVTATKVMVRHPTVHRQDLADLIAPHLSDPLSIGCSGVEFAEVTGAGVDKSHALRHVLTAWGHDAAEVMAFGDNHNDIAMLRWAGTGVAVANAVDDAHDAADLSIGHHADHSVAEHLAATVLG
ncbi:Cof-type HAD-IIB family hydrolase [Ilumatobacter coccineus]|uniref:Cof-type HAD-IIB family hydrolase n=1 Tax=Ilumatobacter coccineus TaxID=467094 RepID=UPI00138B03F5|nr:Cof-type HAD-IIB family hydrolase [Ilumatobacter coccineus]